MNEEKLDSLIEEIIYCCTKEQTIERKYLTHLFMETFNREIRK